MRAIHLKDRILILFPAIDLKDGQCVRLKLGEMDQATVFNDNPAAQALYNTKLAQRFTVPTDAE